MKLHVKFLGTAGVPFHPRPGAQKMWRYLDGTGFDEIAPFRRKSITPRGSKDPNNRVLGLNAILLTVFGPKALLSGYLGPQG